MFHHRPLVLRLAAPLGLAASASIASATTWSVDPSGAGHATSIRGGLSLASPGDTVSVAPGTYYERQIVMKSGVYLTSETGQADCVTIDPEGMGRGFYCLGTGGGAIVGFTVRNGVAAYGGGLFCISLSTPDIINCVFTDNKALVGGGAYLHHSPMTITNTVFSDNTADYFGGGAAVEDFSDPVFVDCSFTGNVAGDGAGVWCYLYSYPRFQDCDISGNRASSAGGGVHCTNADVTLEGCRITGNTAPRGGGIGVWTSHPTVTTCTVAGNHATEAGGGIHAGEGAQLEVANTIVWGNCAPSGEELWTVEATSEIEFTCSCVDVSGASVAGSGTVIWTGTNVHDDPLFCLLPPCLAAPTTGGDFRVSAASPCAAANSGGCGGIGAEGSGSCNLPARAVLPRNWGAVKALYRSGTRR